MQRMIIKILLISGLIFSVHSVFAGPGMPAPMPPLRCDLEPDGPCCQGTIDKCHLPCIISIIKTKFE